LQARIGYWSHWRRSKQTRGCKQGSGIGVTGGGVSRLGVASKDRVLESLEEGPDPSKGRVWGSLASKDGVLGSLGSLGRLEEGKRTSEQANKGLKVRVGYTGVIRAPGGGQVAGYVRNL